MDIVCNDYAGKAKVNLAVGAACILVVALFSGLFDAVAAEVALGQKVGIYFAAPAWHDVALGVASFGRVIQADIALFGAFLDSVPTFLADRGAGSIASPSIGGVN